MPTLRQKVDHFCKDSGSKVGDSDKLRTQVAALKAELKKVKDTHKAHMKEMKAAAKTRKAPKAPAAPKAPKVKQEVAMNPLPSNMPSAGPMVASAGRRTRRRL